MCMNDRGRKAGIFDLGFFRRGEDGSFEVCGVPLKRAPMLRLMRLAQRGGVLLRCLSLAEYMFLRLVVKLTDRVRSFILARAVAPVIKKLFEAIKCFPRFMMEVLGKVGYWMMVKGWEKAEEISRIAQRWGNRAALKWAREPGFARYLTIMNMSFWESEGNREATVRHPEICRMSSVA